MSREHRLKEGDAVLLVDRKGRRYLQVLDPAKTFHSHLGPLPHAAIIGQEPGCRVQIATGHRFLVLRATLADFIQELPRRTQIIYPKDAGAILVYGDVFPGAVVVEAGLGSGALTLALLRAVGGEGKVVSYELEAKRVDSALANIRAFRLPLENLTVKVGDVYQGIEEREVDRVVLDVPEPWFVVASAAEALAPGGVFLSFVPTVLQVHQLREALHEHPEFDMAETVEVIVRPWHVEGRSVRPVHRMVAHTGFITTARKCAPGKMPRTR
ncbi:MAG: tRNA (adenine-N1)-methyltransferase [Chloroflexi bacterium]|nr:tRNA (adenine-N1)-methyltransferase [Chloroflexota bacterium]